MHNPFLNFSRLPFAYSKLSSTIRFPKQELAVDFVCLVVVGNNRGLQEIVMKNHNNAVHNP